MVFVDDGSTDGSAELFGRLLPQATCIKQENRGVGATRNRAVEVAHGEFLQFLDADDTIEPGKFETQLPFARSHSMDVIYSDWRMIVVDGDTEICEPWVSAETKDEIVEALLGGWWYPTTAPLVRTEAFRAVGGCDPTLINTCDDFDLWVRLGIAGFRFGYVPGKFSNYYRYLQVRSISRKNPREFFEGEARIILKAMRLLEAQNAATPARCRAATKRLHAVARNAFAIDRSWYGVLMKEVRRIDPHFQPAGPFAYRLAWHCFGMEAAELLALWRRRLFARQNG